MRDRTHADASTSKPTPPPRTPPPAPAADSSIAVDMACGAVAGVAYTVSAHPFDTVKVAMQTRPTHPPRSALEVTAEICRGPRGALGLFRGLAAPLVGYSVEAGINYAAFNQGRRWLEHNNPFVVAGAGAGAAAPRDGAGDASPRRSCAASGALGGSLLSLVVAPTDLIKCRIQDGQFRRARDAVADVVTKHGVFGMTRGVAATLAREVPGNALFFTVYEAAQMAFPRWVAHPHPHPHGVVSKPAYATQEAAASVVCGGVAGSAFWLAILPIDLAKTRYQIASPGAADDVGVWRLLARETSRTGARGLWAGLGPVLARAFPANAVQFLAWEGACQLAGVRREHGR
ncbi:mitochondrial carrier family [Micromonas commoda]|uniref:Mitochondrial carrier family n=1 Tax=Micromonas commoda (strain RCC299 / NOUM17 / CCMP2709) TaxID=296587 RepID=C1FES4_MICCC|nr:mitochondrial carrier family [Micromonas commoda]ACO68622.1 mitochondrial carrier family [Micromonas commoda]|eukprot:XP_002507364.1 mitochondrial carrier family [Micromonas commoda]